MKRDEKGRFAGKDGKSIGMYIDDKGYWRYSAGPHRGKRVHRVEAEKMIGKPLDKSEDVHHGLKGKQCNDWDNLTVLGHKEHGAVSAAQHHWAKTNDFNLKQDWDSVLDSIEAEEVEFNPATFTEEVAAD